MKRSGITKAQLRDLLKHAFEAGFSAARQGDMKSAWENAAMRKEIDYHGLHERLEISAAEQVELVPTGDRTAP